MPFDRFVIDQIAGDLQPGAAQAARIATGFHRNTPINQEGGIDVEQFRVESIVDRVNTTGTVFLGLTVGCASATTTSTIPISQRDYYRLFAFFNNVDEPELEISTPAETGPSPARSGTASIDSIASWPRRYPDLDERERRWEEMLPPDSQDERGHRGQAGVRRGAGQAVDGPAAGPRGADDRRRPGIPGRARRPEGSADRRAEARHHDGRPRAHAARRDRPSCTWAATSRGKGDRVEPGVPAVLPALEDESPGHRPDRMDLARWLVDRRNPLTARVAVNRIWQAYFGRGLVETDNDFGTPGLAAQPPRAARLAGLRADRQRLEPQGDPPPDRRVGDLPPGVAGPGRLPGGRSRQPPALAAGPAPARRRADPRRGAGQQRAPHARVGGPSVFPPQPEGVMNLGQMRRPVAAGHGPGPLSAGPLHVLLAGHALRLPDHLRRAGRRPDLHAPAALEHAAPGADPAQRPGLRRDRPRAGRADPGGSPAACERRRADRPCVPALPGPSAARSRAAGAGRLPEGRASRRRPGRRSPSTAPPEWIGLARILLNLDEFVTRE